MAPTRNLQATLPYCINLTWGDGHIEDKWLDKYVKSDAAWKQEAKKKFTSVGYPKKCGFLTNGTTTSTAGRSPLNDNAGTCPFGSKGGYLEVSLEADVRSVPEDFYGLGLFMSPTAAFCFRVIAVENTTGQIV
jgi:hypothetical protein